jgi:23S rRNA pseudouridine2605 synthase
MRLNKYIALGTGLSRRAADAAIVAGRVTINGQTADTGRQVTAGDVVTLDGRAIALIVKTLTLMLHKPTGYVVSRNGQGSKTIYDLLPEEYHSLKPVGRLDKDSSGLLLLTNDGELAHRLTHPSFRKLKIYELTLNKALEPLHQQMISGQGVPLDDGPSKLHLEKLNNLRTDWRITMHEGRNRQIRRTFEALDYRVAKLHRIQFGDYRLDLKPGSYTLFGSA